MALLVEGQTIRETYVVERFLGEGAFAEVYRVQHRFLGRQAMKVLKLPGASQGEIEELLTEALLLSKLGHPNIIRVFDANTLQVGEALHGYCTMEYVAGGSLDRLWRSYGDAPMPVGDAVEIICQVCAGVAVAHSEKPPIVHRDIKPQNVLVGYDGAGLRVRVSDFGLAKHANPLTLLVSAKGTIGFKPPESLSNQDSPAADVWAIGTTLYLLLTDTLPFPDLNERGVGDARSFTTPLRPASVHNVYVDSALDAVLARSLAVHPRDRYQDAAAFLTELLHWHPDNTPKVSSESPTEIGHQSTATLEKRPALDAAAARELIENALSTSKAPGCLGKAADMLEEAISAVPEFREQYEGQLVLWRRGVSM